MESGDGSRESTRAGAGLNAGIIGAGTAVCGEYRVDWG